MKNTKENIIKSIENYEATYRDSKNGVTYKYVGNSVFDASAVFDEYLSKFSIAKGSILNHEYTGRRYTRKGDEYPSNAYIR